MDTMEIKGVEIFASGTWNGDTYSDKDLDEMASNFKETKDLMKPYLKLGHDKGQKLSQSDGLPALGWVENVRRIGTKLVADFKRIPKAVYDLIKSGGYRRVSSEIFIDLELDGKKYGKVLKAVALLGADTPAVQTLKDIMNLYKDNSVSMEAYSQTDCKSYEFDAGVSKEEEEEMKTIEQLEKELADSHKALAEANGKLSEYKVAEEKKYSQMETDLKAAKDESSSMKSENEKLKGEVKAFSAREAETKVNADVEKLIQGKHILPAQKEYVIASLKSAFCSEKKFKIGEKESSEYDHMVTMFSQGTVDVNTETNTGAGEKQVSGEGDATDEEVRNFIKQSKSEGREVSYRDAHAQISRIKREKANK